MAQKRISRARKRDLEEPDKLTAFLHEIVAFTSKYKIHLLSVLGIIVAVIVVVAGVFYFTNKAENTAFSLLSHGLNKYQTVASNSGFEKAYLEVADDFKLILQKYSGRKGAKIAGFMFANICYSAGRYDEAIGLYTQSLKDFGDNPFLKNLILDSLGYAYEAQVDYKTAAKYYEMVASAPGYSMQDEALFNLAGVYAEMGEYDQRRTAFKKIMSEHKDSIYLKIVEETLSGQT